MFHVVLVRPEIPANTGAIIRLCANAGAALHVVGARGFDLSDAALRRGGLDYHDLTPVTFYETWAEFREAHPRRRLWGFTSRAATSHVSVDFEQGDALVFGSESVGLDEQMLTEIGADRLLRVPMAPANRSLNLSNVASIAVYEAWRQHGFVGGV